MKAHFRKVPGGLAPDDIEATKLLERYKLGDVLSAEVKKPRNYEFHKKFFALMHYAFDQWEPEGMPEKNFERFREDITIAAGYYDLVPAINGELRAKAKSISFASMSEFEFEELYDAAVNALLKWVLRNHTRDDVDRVMTQIAEFGG